MARATKLSHSTVSGIWRAFGLHLRRVKIFKFSSDPFFVEKVWSLAELYMNLPDHAVVVFGDEKSQVQALDRTRLALPLRPGIPELQGHDYIRHGTTALLAALEVVTSKMIGKYHSRHSSQEFLKSLEEVDRQIPTQSHLHLVMDNYGTHNHPHVQAWLQRHSRFVCHFVPTSSSWLSLIERWFGDLTTQARPSA